MTTAKSAHPLSGIPATPPTHRLEAGPCRASAAPKRSPPARPVAADAEPAPAACCGPQRRPERSSGPDIRLVSATPETALDVADETVDRLLDEGTAPDTILVLTTGEAHPWQQHEESLRRASRTGASTPKATTSSTPAPSATARCAATPSSWW
ncbi:hypothetical protein ACU686_37375 [Yinghuangia aomiensis]